MPEIRVTLLGRFAVMVGGIRADRRSYAGVTAHSFL
jgi:hypothetical protein